MGRKDHILSNKKKIQQLFHNGKIIKNFPLVIYTLKSDQPKVLFSISKKKISKAVDRNKIKRQLQAIYFNEFKFHHEKALNITLAIVYVSTNPVPYLKLKVAMSNIIKQLKDEN